MIINGLDLFQKAPIKKMINEKRIHKGRSYGLSEVGYDIRLKQKIVFNPYSYAIDMGWSYPQQVHTIDLYENELASNSTLIKGNFCLASSIEEFNMPNDLMGVVHDKSTNVREGIQVFNTVIEPGWKGFLTLEIAFHGNKAITLEAGTPIAQVIFHQVLNPTEYKGKYQNQEDKPVEAIYE